MAGQYWTPNSVNGIPIPGAQQPQQPQQPAPSGGGRYWSPGMVNGIASPMYQQPQQQLPGLLGPLGGMPGHTPHPSAGFNPRQSSAPVGGLPRPAGQQAQPFGQLMGNGGMAALLRMVAGQRAGGPPPGYYSSGGAFTGGRQMDPNYDPGFM